MLGPAAVVLISILSAGGPSSYDTVRLEGGGVARGTVIEDDPVNGVALQLPGGEIRRWARAEVASVEYAKPAAAAEDARPEAAHVAAPLPFTLSLGTGAAVTAGDVGSRAGSTSRWWPGFTLLQVEAGFRTAQRWTTLVYLDGGAGDAVGSLRRECRAQGYDCGAGSARLGVMERYTFAPAERRTPWVAIGTGWESTGVLVKGAAGTQRIAFNGWEALKLAAGYDFRFTRWFGLGLFAGTSIASYGKASVSGPMYEPAPELGARRVHAWFQVGGRAILFP